VVAMKYYGDQNASLESFCFISGKFLLISLDVIVFMAFKYLGIIRVGLA
jgi:hypothetical protein